MRHITIEQQAWPVAGEFRIAHGTLSEIHLVRVTLTQNGKTGRGECRPYARYSETPESVAAQIEGISTPLKNNLTRQALQYALPHGAARNAVDCALWDLKAKLSGNSVYKMLGLPAPIARKTAFTLSIDTPTAMANAARAAKAYTVLKLKIDGAVGLKAAKAVMAARPDVELIIDANEALGADDIIAFQSALTGYPVLLIEQPVPAKIALTSRVNPNVLPIICADESLHTRKDLQALWNAGYRAVNIKLDKCGGLTEGISLMREAKAMGFVIMAGCMVGTSLAMAPMLHIAGLADIIDLDGPALLARDCEQGLTYNRGCVSVPPKALWGYP